jgi:hypothetical protein
MSSFLRCILCSSLLLILSRSVETEGLSSNHMPPTLPSRFADYDTQRSLCFIAGDLLFAPGGVPKLSDLQIWQHIYFLLFMILHLTLRSGIN